MSPIHRPAIPPPYPLTYAHGPTAHRRSLVRPAVLLGLLFLSCIFYLQQFFDPDWQCKPFPFNGESVQHVKWISTADIEI